MKFLFYALFFLIFTLFSHALNDSACEQEFKPYMVCAKAKVNSEADHDWNAKRTELRTKIGDCFTKIGCTTPDYDKDPSSQLSPQLKNVVAKMKQQWNDTPEEVKQCLKKRMMEKLGEKMNDCLTKKNVQNVNFSNIVEPRLRPNPDGQGLGIGPFGAFDSHGNKTAIERAETTYFMKANIAKTYRQCVSAKGPDSSSLIVSCLLQIKTQQKTDYCQAIEKPCSANVSTDCQTRAQQIYQAVCKCKKEDERVILDKLNGVLRQANGADVPLGDLIKVLGPNQDPRDLIKTAMQCYTDNQVDPPQALKFAEAIATSQTDQPGGASKPTAIHPKIDSETLTNLQDVLSFDADDETDCQPCS